MSDSKASSPETWEHIYSSDGQNNFAPYTEIFSFLNRSRAGKAPGGRLLELGSGVGNNLAFARWNSGWDVYGMEASESALELCKERFRRQGLEYADLRLGTFPPIPYPDGFFDAVIDRATIQHNTLQAIHAIVKEVFRALKPGGLFFSSAIAENHALFGKGRALGQGDFDNPDVDGIRHFFSRAQVMEVFRDFEITSWHLVTRQDMLDGNRIVNGIYNVEMRKPA